MSISSEVEPTPPSAGPNGAHPSGKVLKWHGRVLGICFAIFAMEVGLFLLVFPWLPSWDVNWVPLQSEHLRALWLSRYFRGGLSGLGLVNLYVGVSELGRQLRSLVR